MRDRIPNPNPNPIPNPIKTALAVALTASVVMVGGCGKSGGNGGSGNGGGGDAPPTSAPGATSSLTGSTDAAKTAAARTVDDAGRAASDTAERAAAAAARAASETTTDLDLIGKRVSYFDDKTRQAYSMAANLFGDRPLSKIVNQLKAKVTRAQEYYTELGTAEGDRKTELLGLCNDLIADMKQLDAQAIKRLEELRDSGAQPSLGLQDPDDTRGKPTGDPDDPDDPDDSGGDGDGGS